MALEALAAEVRAVLGAARRLFGSAPQRAELSADNTGRTVGALDVQQHDVAAGQWSGQGAQSYGVRLLGATSAATRVAGADGQMSGQLAAAASTAGQASSTVSRIAERTDGGVAALAPTTDTAAGRAALAAHLERQLDAVQNAVNNGQLHDAAIGQNIRTAAQGYEIAPRGHVDPKPPPEREAPALCWIGTEDGDVAAICPPNTEEVSYVDDDGNYVSKNLRTGEVTVVMAPGSLPVNPSVCWLPSPGADRSICGPATTSWIYPKGGYLITEELGPDGKTRVTFRTPLGPLIP